MKNKVGIVVTARVKSSRIKDKVLQKIGNKRTIEILLDHVIGNDAESFPVVLAIPENTDDDILEEIGNDYGVYVYRGQDKSPLHRIYEVAKKYEFDHVIRVTADDILIDQKLLRFQVRAHIKGNRDYTTMLRCPGGMSAEVIRFNALEHAALENETPVEFVSYYVKKGFNCFDFYPPYEYQTQYRLVMDYPEDLMLLRIVFALLPKDAFGTLDIMHLLKAHKYLLRINHLPKLTFYTSVYNTQPFIKRTMQSIVNQTFQDWEYIIVDDNSSDNSLKEIMNYYSSLNYSTQQKFKIITNKKNIGLPASCNKVVSIARGRYICRVDSDDTIKKDFAEKMLFELDGDLTKSAVFSGYNNIDEADSVIDTVNKNMLHPACCVLKTRAVNELKYMEHLKYCEGDEFFNRFKQMYDISFINEVLWNYRKREGQKTSCIDHPNNK